MITSNNSRRVVCSRCQRPAHNACLCPAVPATPVRLRHCRIAVLQHPHEVKRKNASLPILQLCLQQPESLQVAVGRRLPQQPLPPAHPPTTTTTSSSPDVVEGTQQEDNNNDLMNIRKILFDNENENGETKKVVWLIFPHAEAISLQDALKTLQPQQQQQEQPAATATNANNSSSLQPTSSHESLSSSSSSSPPVCVVLFFLDGTWKHTKEMDRGNEMAQCYPNNNNNNNSMIRVQLTESDLHDYFQTHPTRRFDIRTPVSDQHLSTAECIAYVASRVEEQQQQQHQFDNNEDHHSDLYETLMKPLDFMVQQWHSHYKRKSNDDDDDNDEKARKSQKVSSSIKYNNNKMSVQQP